MTDPPNYYHVLGLTPPASPEQVRASYIRLLKQHHPDRVARGPASQRLQHIHQAYRCLRDAERRAAHDCDLLMRERAHRSRVRRVRRRMRRLDRRRPKLGFARRSYVMVAASGGVLFLLAHLLTP